MWLGRVMLVVGGAAVTAALWFAFRPPVPEAPRAAPAAAPAASGVAAATPAPLPVQVFELTVAGGRLVSGPALMQVHEGDPVVIRVRSDGNDELHLHGYDLERKLKAGETASLQFDARRSGHFGLELHQAHVELGALEVYPR